MKGIIDLNGTWDFIADLDPKYHQLNSYPSPAWDRSNWEKAVVPGVWNMFQEKYSIYEGVCWYARDFEYDGETEGVTALLRFGGVNYKCDIFLNGEKAGEHEGGYTEFAVDVSRLLKKGSNCLVLRVDNRALIMKMPAVIGWFNYGGIHRDVCLEVYRGAYFSDLFVYGKHDGTLSVKGAVNTQEAPGLQVEITCGETSKKIEAADGAFETSFQIPGVKTWSPEEPNLYPVNISLASEGKVQDEITLDTGFRSISVEGTDITLNGTKTFLKGICYLYDSPDYGLVMKKEQYLKDIALIKELGVNIIRSHFQFSDAFLSECDRQGLMVWIEAPVYCIAPKKEEKNTVFSDESYKKLALLMIEELIGQAKNHPSVVIYGIGNECTVENPEAEGFFRAIADKAREKDSTRLLSYAALYGTVGPLADIVDVIGVNEYWGWYDVIGLGKKLDKINLDKLENKLKELTANHKKPLVISEFAADAVPGFLSKSHELWSEDYYSEFFEKSFEVFKKYPVCGTFPFLFNDYRDPSKYIGKYWDGMNYKGVVSYSRKPKKPFYTLK
ncbi:MAG: hypothetical protein JW957_05465, partial [Candidatus Omnitrophica bacterium]|nr:hypothetical protein [Candidatus Omnitrophota bacterium]